MDTPILDRYLATLDHPASQRAARADLTGFVRWWETKHQRPFEPQLWLAKDCDAWVRYRQDEDECKPATINRGLSSLRQFGEWLCVAHLAMENPAQACEGIPLETTSPKALPPEAVDALLRTIQREPDRFLRLRDTVLFTILAYTGLRSQEVCDLQLRDLDLDGAQLVVRKGKGGKARRVPLHRDVIMVLQRYLNEVRCPNGLPAVGSADEREALLVTKDRTKPGHPIAPGISTRLIRHRMHELCRQAADQLRVVAHKEPQRSKADQWRKLATQLERASPHTLRHSLARRMLQQGADLSEVQRILGHSRVTTTGMYTLPDDDDLRAAIERAGI